MSRSRRHARRPAAALILSLAACRPAGRSEPAPPHQPAEATPSRPTAEAPPPNPTAEVTPSQAMAEATSPPVTPASPPPTSACEDPTAALAGFGWLPTEVHALVSVRLHDPRLPRSLDTLADFARGPFTQPVAWTHFAAELPGLRALLTAAKLRPDHAVYFLAGPDVGVWAIPGSCEPDAFAQLAATLELEVRQASGPTAITIATGPAIGRHVLVHRPEGGQLWIARADQQVPLLAWIHGLSGGSWDCCEEQFQRDHADATVRVFLLPDVSTFRQHSVTGSSLVTSAHISCFVTPTPKPD